ncbi:hypothetical protein [Frateuria terrea]|uniref:Uncharacterized protein n=1 Tax=Frateuria terrea TaxID=529704 RepID=A0A1H6UQ79_9GAMM|nr:hypothetical protein [Frateuria terrea]SEI92864.1 hypothetical protein SAMN04487997_2068 [Frateuria terrea]SFP35073.1 hypothetical protein SAMN02927913_1659 [Frateuria terrea]
MTAGRGKPRITTARGKVLSFVRVKRWLVSLGVNLENINDAEQALFAAFDKLA